MTRQSLAHGVALSRIGVLGGLAILFSLGIVSVACSDDDNNGTTNTQTDGGPEGGSGNVDSGSCPAQPPKTCGGATCASGSVCVKDKCVQLKSEECPVAVGALDSQDVLVFGAVHDLFGGQKVPGQAGMNSAELAVNEINEKGGLRDPDKCKPAKKLVMVGCNDSNINPDGTPYVAPDGGTELTRQQRVIEHLANELDVPIITGGTTSGTTLALNLYQMKAKAYNKVYLTTRSTSPIFEHPENNPEASQFNPYAADGTRLFWRSTHNAKGQTAAMRLVLEQVVAASKARFSYSGDAKVALLVKNDAFGIGTANAFEEGLTVNGAAAGGSNVNANYLRLDYRERPGTGLAGQPEQDDALQQLKDFEPDVIVTITTDELIKGTVGITDVRNVGFLKPYEEYVRANVGVRKPFWLHSHATIANATTAYLNDLAGSFGDEATRKDFLERTRGTNLSEPTDLAQQFFNRYKANGDKDEKFKSPVESIYGMPESYDSVYITAYLMAATFWKPEGVTPTTLGKAFPSLVEGTSSIDNGPAAFNAAIQTLITGGKINYNGAVGPFDWDYSIGESKYNSNVWCAQVNAETGSVFYQQKTGQVWRFSNGQLEGTYNCPQ